MDKTQEKNPQAKNGATLSKPIPPKPRYISDRSTKVYRYDPEEFDSNGKPLKK